ncbi:MAG: DNA polymerase [Minisyncoccia bacterium]
MAKRNQENQKEHGGARKRLILLDSHAILHRAFHAIPDFSTSSGKPTGALYGLVTMLLKTIDDLSPDYLIAARDLPGGTFRDKLFEDYKGTRAPTDDALVEQLKIAPTIFEAFGIPVYSEPGFEADDVIGTVVKKLEKKEDIEVIIASGDLDTLQLVSGKKVQVYTLRQGITDTILYDEDRVRERYGFGPELVPDYKGLRGDPSDNIKGIKGIGEKTAEALITNFGSIEDIYTALKKEPEEFEKAGIKKRIVGLLIEGEKDARFSKELATIHRDVPIDFTLPEKPWAITDHAASIDAMCELYEFRAVRERIKTKLSKVNTVPDEEVPAEEKPETAPIGPQVFAETATALWLVKSDITNPSLQEILDFARTEDFEEARETIFKELNETGRLREVFDKIEKPLLPIVQKMNATGVCLNKKMLEKLGKEYRKELGEIAGRIYNHVGHEFNISSPRQLAVVLFDELKIPVEKQKKTATGARTTKEEELAKLAHLHPIIEEILSFRELSKLLSTYVEKMVELIGPDGRLHAEFLQNSTTTGRMGCQNPNLQNIPVRTEYGRRIRSAFAAPEGSVLLALDYSQIELRLAAGLSGDQKLLNVFKTGGDIHAAVASQVFAVPPEHVDREMRRRAKIINFGILYGMGVNALRSSLGESVSREEAARFLEEYFVGFPGLAKWIEFTKRDAALKGYTETIYGRRRYLPGFKSALPMMRAQAERYAINAPIQGAQADIIKLAMVRADDMIEKKDWQEKAKLVLQVHDELVYEVKEEIAESAAEEIRIVMEGVVPEGELSGVPIVTDTAIGKDWGEMRKHGASQGRSA